MAFVCGSKSGPYIDSIFGMFDFIDELLGIGFAAALQIGVDQEVHGVELVAFAAHAHGGGLARSRDGGEIGIDVVLPEADAGEDVRRHVQRMRRGRSDLRIAAGGRNSELRQLRLVVAVDQIMRHARMIGLGGEELFKNRGCLFAVGECLVVVGLGGKQRERVESCGFVIVGIGLDTLSSSRRNRLWRGRRGRAFPSRNRTRRSLRCSRFRGQWLSWPVFRQLFTFQAASDDFGVRFIPELMPDAHGDAPVSHGAVRIVLCNLNEFLFGLFVPERVQQGDSAGEGFLHRRGTGNREVNGAKLSLGEVFVVVMIFVVVGEGGKLSKTDEQQKRGKSIHRFPAEWRGKF